MLDTLTDEKRGDVVLTTDPRTSKQARLELCQLDAGGDRVYKMEDGEYVREVWHVRAVHKKRREIVPFKKTFYRRREVSTCSG